MIYLIQTELLFPETITSNYLKEFDIEDIETILTRHLEPRGVEVLAGSVKTLQECADHYKMSFRRIRDLEQGATDICTEEFEVLKVYKYEKD